jgi:hypothetical protein
MQCWQDIAQFQQFLQCMLSQAGPVPLQGVTDGSNAKSGYIGEFMTAISTMPFAAYPANNTGVVSTIVIPPGDWDLRGSMQFSAWFGYAGFNLSPVPAGVSNAMTGGLGVGVPGTQVVDLAVINGATARGSFTVPTLLAFKWWVDQSQDSALLAGTANLTIDARRVR